MDINTDKTKFPNADEPQLQVAFVTDDGLLTYEDRKLEIVPSKFTVESLEKTIKRHEYQIVIIETHKEKYEKLLEFARKNGVIATDDEYTKLQFIKSKKAHIAKLKENKNPTPKDIATIKAMERELKKAIDTPYEEKKEDVQRAKDK